MKLSVIIPVYCVERTLDRCIESVLRQRVQEMEVILVDDGSPDRCPELCDAWQRRDARIRVVHQQNGGLSVARNKGMEAATGELLTFVDSDDEVADGTYAPLVAYMAGHADCDLIEYSACIHAGSDAERRLTLEDRIWPSPRRYWEATEAWEHCYAWNKVYRRGTLAGMQFPQGRAFEDAWFYPELLSRCHCIATTSWGTYIYHWNKSGITAQADGERLTQLLESLQRAARLMRTRLLSLHGLKLYRSMLCRQIDIYRLTGRILLRFPLCRLVCILHKLARR